MSVADRRRQTDVSSTLNTLSLNPTSKPRKSVHAPLADNWDDNMSGSDTETESDALTPALSSAGPLTGKSSGSSAPPPTPMTPNMAASFDNPYSVGTSGFENGEPMTPMRGNFKPPQSAGLDGGFGGFDGEKERERPEKSTATAARMIAAGLGVRQPKKSEDLVRYERAVREKEGRRIEKEREDRGRVEEARRAMWDD